MIYLDYQATTPLAPEAFEAMVPWLRDSHANPHSPHREGRRARAAVEVARAQLAALLPPGGQVVFTSGATESLNWAIKGVNGPTRTLTSEHAAVLDSVMACGGTAIRVEADGMVCGNALTAPGVTMVSAMLVNNEIGVIQPIARLAREAHDAGALFLCDAVQGFGRVPIPPECDLISVSAHKIHGPKGIGALWIRDGITLRPLMHGGGQEAAGRSGTLSPALCAGFGAAAILAAQRFEQDQAHVVRLWDTALAVLGSEWIVNGSTEHRYRGNLNVRLRGLDVGRLLSDCRDIAFSAGSACASGSGRTSHVLRAIGLADSEAKSSIRIGFGRYTTERELVDGLTRIDRAAREQGI